MTRTLVALATFQGPSDSAVGLFTYRGFEPGAMLVTTSNLADVSALETRIVQNLTALMEGLERRPVYAHSPVHGEHCEFQAVNT